MTDEMSIIARFAIVSLIAGAVFYVGSCKDREAERWGAWFAANGCVKVEYVPGGFGTSRDWVYRCNGHLMNKWDILRESNK